MSCAAQDTRSTEINFSSKAPSQPAWGFLFLAQTWHRSAAAGTPFVPDVSNGLLAATRRREKNALFAMVSGIAHGWHCAS
jgi:hypothetical protein